MATVGKQSRIRLVYPFSFAPDRFEALVDRVGALRFSRTKRDGSQHAPAYQWQAVGDDTADIHSAKLEAAGTLSSDVTLEEEPDQEDAIAAQKSREGADWRGLGAVRDFIDGTDDGDSTTSTRHAGLQSWRLNHDYLQWKEGLNSQGWAYAYYETTIPLKVPGATLTLMRHGAGLIGLDFEPKSKDLEDWLRFLTRARLPDRRRQGFLLTRSTGKDVSVPHWPPAFPPAEDQAEPRPLYMCFKTLLGQLSEDCDDGRWWHHVSPPGQLTPYYTLLVHDLDAGEQPLVRLQLSRLATNRAGTDPAESQIAPDAPGGVQLSRASWFLASPAGTGLVSFDPQGGYLKEAAPRKVWWPGWCLFALAMQQSVTLHRLSAQVTANWTEEKNLHELRSAKKRLMSFIAEAYFPSLLTPSHMCSQMYGLMIEQLDVRTTYESVRDEIATLHDHLQDAHARQLDFAVKIIGAPVAVVSIVLAFLGVNIANITTAENEGMTVWEAGSMVGICACVGLIVGGLWYRKHR